MKGMMIQCTDCGRLRSFNFDGPAETIESQMDDFISKEGWRFAENRDGFICKGCQQGQTDAFYELYAGKAKCLPKAESYFRLLQEVVQMINEYQILGGL